MTGAEAGDRELDRPHMPGSVVPCPLKQGQAIAVARCVEYQRENGCHCEHALVALGHRERQLQEAPDPSPGAAAALFRELDEVEALIRRAEEIEKSRPPPAPPAKEEPVAEEKRCSKCGWSLRADNTKGVCGDGAACRRRCQRNPDRTSPAAPSAAQPMPAGGDVVQLLEAQLAHHRAQAEKIEKALEVLR